MKIFDRITELRHYLELQRKNGSIIGLVPTMGALHDGHAQLVREAVKICDLTVCSIFVNPTQFNNHEDLLAYPKRSREDQELLRREGCHVVFSPSADEMYPSDESTLKFDFGSLEKVMEGAFRPGHFSGVGVVVSKLLNIVQPDKAFFGQKDLQQLAVIKKLVKDLNIQTDVVPVPTIRETNGLAMSSRNLRLSEEQKTIASNLFHKMTELKKKVLSGVDIKNARAEVLVELQEVRGMDIEYMEVVDSETMAAVTDLDNAPQISVCAAAYVGGVRIIDNLYIKQ